MSNLWWEVFKKYNVLGVNNSIQGFEKFSKID